MRNPSACVIAALVVAAGCQEYQFNGDPKNGLPTTTGGSTGLGTTPPPPTTTTPAAPPHGDNEQIDDVVVPALTQVDVLWIVDNSGSMGDNQAALTAESATFMDPFVNAVGLDYHIGVVTTDIEAVTDSGKLREAQGVRWIDSTTADPYGVFNQMVLAGTAGSGNECGRGATEKALDDELDGWNAGFVRDEAPMAVIVISDEPDSSDMFGYDIPSFVSFMQGFKPDPAMVSMSTIVGPVYAFQGVDGCTDAYGQSAAAGTGYPDVQTALGGLFWSICDPDWDSVLSALAALAIGSRQEFLLTQIPIPDTIQVEIDEADGTQTMLTQLGTDFSYDAVRNSVTLLTYVPGPLADVYLHYQVDWGADP